MSVKTETLELMCELIVDCPHSTPKWTDSGYVVTRNQNIKNGVLDLNSPSFTNEEGYNSRIKRAKPKAGDIIFTREAPMGEVCMIPKGLKCCLGQRQVLLRPKNTICGEYLFWALQSPFVQHQISWNEGTGSTVSNVRIPVLKALNIPRQDKEDYIAKVLSDLAEKIELNRQTNQTLEHIAQALFKCWFVDFEPTRAKIIAKDKGANSAIQELAAQAIISGAITLEQLEAIAQNLETTLQQAINEKLNQANQTPINTEQLKTTAALFPNELVESDGVTNSSGTNLHERSEPEGAGSGMSRLIPEGWEVLPLSKMIQIIGGGTPKKSESDYWDGDIPWFSVKDAPADGDVFVIDTDLKITELGLSKSSTKLLPEGVTIISARGTVGRLALVGVPTAMNQSCYGIKGANGAGTYLNYFNVKNAVEMLQQNTHGAVFDTITTGTFDTVYSVNSGQKLKDVFEALVSDNFKKIKNNLFESNGLIEIRDTLLPKLLSGELKVS